MAPHVIITGGSSGIGKALAEVFLKNSYYLSLIARRPKLLNETRSTLLAQFPQANIHCYSADVTNKDAITKAIQQAIKQSGPPDTVITSAGLACCNSLEQTTEADYRAMMEVNYFGTVHTINAVLPTMLHEAKGHIVLISSAVAIQGIYGYVAYAPSKYALTGYAEVLRSELKPKHINVSIAYPPDTDTPQLAAENLTKPIATKLLSASAGLWQPSQVAQHLYASIKRNKFIITFGLGFTLLNRCNHLLSPLIRFYCDRKIRQAL